MCRIFDMIRHKGCEKKHYFCAFNTLMKSKLLKTLDNRIIRSDWHATRLMGIISESDIYYVQLSNKILSIISKIEGESLISNKVKRDISVRIAAYFEDVISGLGLWRAIIEIHHKMYESYLPFFQLNAEKYFEDEINIEDIQFLVWSNMQGYLIDSQQQRFLNPENPFLVELALEIYTLLDSEYETAPANESLFRIIRELEFKDDIISVREMLGWLHYDSYLSMSYTHKNLKGEIHGLKTGDNKSFFAENSEILTYAMEKVGIFSKTCSPIAIKAKDWAAQIFSGTPKANLFETIDFRQISNYNIVQVDSDTFTLIDSDKEIYIVSVDSVSTPEALHENKSIMCSLLFYNQLWHINGFAAFANARTDLDIMPSKAKILANNRQVYNHLFKELKEEIAYYHSSDDLKQAMSELFPLTERSKFLPADFNKQTDFILFIHPESGLSIYPELALYVSDVKNPFYDIAAVEQEGLGILTGHFKLPKELLEYLIDRKFLKDVSLNSLHGKEYGKNLLQKNIRFIVRFFQPELYN